MAFVRVNGVVLHHQVSGTPGKPAIVFSNSLGTDFRIWEGVAERLAEDYQLVFYDKRGHGLSQSSPKPYAMDTLADDLAALLDHLDLKRCAVVGLSVGGVIAQALAGKRPDLVSALVLMDTAHKIGTKDGWNTRIDTIRQKGMAAVADGILKGWLTADYRENAPDFEGYKAMLMRNDVEGYAAVCAALRDADLTETTRKLTVPTLAIVGEHDATTTPAIMRETANLIDGARVEVVKDAGHLPCIERPEEVSALIRGFLESTRH